MFQFMNPAYDPVMSSASPKDPESYLEVIPEQGCPEVEDETGNAEEDTTAKPLADSEQASKDDSQET
jgi:hypothetical protein